MTAELLGDRFERRRLVGTGGMGDVYQALDRLTGELVAVKLLLATPAGNALERFRREIQLLAELKDPRIVRYIAHGLTKEGRPFLAMEWLEGQELAHRLGYGPLPLSEAVALITRVAEGLAVLHARGVIHRDIKPSNIFLVGSDVSRAKVLDFGVARFADVTLRATKTGVMVGTPGYMAPEQARGETEIDARADVYALGCVLYECLVGEPLYTGANMVGILAKILLGETPRAREKRREISRELDDLLARMLGRTPGERPADAASVIAELARLPGISAEPSGPTVPPPGESRAITRTERRLVSVLLVADAAQLDVPHSRRPSGVETTVAAKMDPRLVVAQFSAEAEPLADGSLVAVLSGKGTATDQASRAARCALELRKHVGGRAMALATGFAARDSVLAAREVIDRAAALLPTADGTSIRLDDVTAGLLGHRFEVRGDDLGLMLDGYREEQTLPRTLLGRPMPFVGRERELATLLGVARECDDDSCARPVLVTAPPGIGKTRLAQEFVKTLLAEGRAEVFVAHGDAVSEGSPFSLLAQALRSCAGIVEGEPLAVRQKKLRARVARNASAPEVERITEFLAEIIGAPLAESASVLLRSARRDPRLMGDQMLAAFQDFIAAECKARPLAIVLEDLQWGDLPSVRFLDSVLRTLDEQPLTVVAFGRPEVEELFPGLWRERNLTEIRLPPLSKRASEALVRAALGSEIGEERLRRLLDRASGNAFFLEELVRASAEGNEDFPPTVLAMVESRLERLEVDARRVLRAASVFGLSFWARGAAALLGAERAGGVDEWLAELVRRELAVRASTSTILDEHEYVFRNALVREAAYATLTAEDRALGHKLAAAWLEGKGGGEPTVLAEHYEKGGDRENAARWYGAAAVLAHGGDDFNRANVSARRAIELGASGLEKGRLRYIQLSCTLWAGTLDDAGLAFGLEAMDLLGAASDEGTMAAGTLASVAARKQRLDVLAEVEKRVRDALGEAELSPARVMGASRVVGSLFFAGEYDRANALLVRVESLGRSAIAAEPTAAAWVQYARAMRATVEAQPQEEHAALTKAVAAFEASGDRRSACLHRINMGAGLQNLGMLDLAQDLLERGLADATRMGLTSLAIVAKHNLGAVLSRLDRFAEGIAMEKEAIEGLHAGGDRFLESVARTYLGLMYRVTGQTSEARVALEAALAGVSDLTHARAPVLAALAMVEVESGNAARALELAREAVALADAGGAVFEGETYIRLCLAEALHGTGNVEAAKDAIRDARRRLLERADKISEPAWREAFLTRVRENTQTLSRAKEWLEE